MLKRFSAFLLALVWALALTGCGSGELWGVTILPPAESQGQEQEEPSAPEQGESEAPEVQSPEMESQTPESEPPETQAPESEAPEVTEDGWYSSKEDVALYLHLYGHLPGNFVTKREAQDAGWSGGNVERYTGEGTAIGGNRFGNYEGLLPEQEGRIYTECDIDTVGADSRGAKRIVFSNDGLIYYTGDHYQSFELLYGEE